MAGFGDGQYDLVIATNVLHATPSPHDSLRHARQLLAPGGRLLLHELCPSSKWVNYIFGTLPGWWHGAADARADEPYVQPSRREKELVAAGFERGLDAAVFDSPEPFQMNAIMVAKNPAKETPKLAAAEKRITLLCSVGDDERSVVHQVREQLQSRDYSVDVSHAGESLPAGQDVIALLDLYHPYLENMDAASWESFKSIFTEARDKGVGVLWVTGLSHVQSGVPGPRWAQIIGTARTLRSELMVDVATLEVDDLGALTR